MLFCLICCCYLFLFVVGVVFCYTSCRALVEMRNTSIGLPGGIDLTTHHTTRCMSTTEPHPSALWSDECLKRYEDNREHLKPPSACYRFRSDCSYSLVPASAGGPPLTPFPLFFPVPDRGTGAHARRALQQLALNVHVKHSDLTWPDREHQIK